MVVLVICRFGLLGNDGVAPEQLTWVVASDPGGMIGKVDQGNPVGAGNGHAMAPV